MSFRARFAPSPTGQVHIGNIRTAIFNWLYTRHCGGEFLLRIEDTDLERSTKQAIDALFDCMNWLGLDYDGEPMYQTTQSDAHRRAAAKLIECIEHPRTALPEHLVIGGELYEGESVSRRL